MNLFFDDPAVPSDLVAPKQTQLGPLHARDYRADGVTVGELTYDGSDVLLDGVTLFALANCVEFDLTFSDTDDALVLAQTDTDDLWFWDGAALADIGSDGQNPRIHNDRQAESIVVLSYLRDGLVRYQIYDGTTLSGENTTTLNARTLTGAALGTNDRFQFVGLPLAEAEDTAGAGDATVETEGFEPLRRADFFNILRHLLPRGAAWKLTADNTLRRFVEGVSTVGDAVKTAADNIVLDLLPESTTRLDEWEAQFNLPPSLLTTQQRRDRLDAAWKVKGSLSPRALQDLLQALGFDVYVHEWWDPSTEAVRNPFDYLTDSTRASLAGFDCGDPAMECGEPDAECGNSVEPLGYPLVNIVIDTELAYTVGCGDPAMECGEPEAECGNFSGGADIPREYQIPTDAATWPFFVYIGGETFPDQAVVPTARRDEFEAALLKYTPAHMWVGVLVSYA